MCKVNQNYPYPKIIEAKNSPKDKYRVYETHFRIKFHNFAMEYSTLSREADVNSSTALKATIFQNRNNNNLNTYNKMRSKATDWYEVKVRYEKLQDDGTEKAVTEQYVLDAFSFTEAETNIIEEMSAYISGDFKITDIKPAPYREIFFSDMNNDDRWFKARLQFITIDEKTNKEKRTAVTYLVQGHTLPQAVKYVEEVMGKTMVDYVISNMAETKILDVFEHNAADQMDSAPDAKPEYEA